MVRSQERSQIPELSIGRLAGRAGVNVETIRYYQRRGLMFEPEKPTNGHRRYAAAEVKRVRFIKRAQALGFTLEEVAKLLALDETTACCETRAMVVRKLGVISGKLAELTAMHNALSELVGGCNPIADGSGCPIIQAIAEE